MVWAMRCCFFNRYQLDSTLEACDGLPNSWSQSSCYGGVFMENVASATPRAARPEPDGLPLPLQQTRGQVPQRLLCHANLAHE